MTVKKTRGKSRASIGAVLWILMSMFKTDPPPPPTTQDVRKTPDKTAGDPSRIP